MSKNAAEGLSMSEEEWLTDAEVESLTGLRQTAAQKRILKNMGVHFFPRPDGRPVVSRWAIRHKAAGLSLVYDAGIEWTVGTGPDMSKVR